MGVWTEMMCKKHNYTLNGLVPKTSVGGRIIEEYKFTCKHCGQVTFIYKSMWEWLMKGNRPAWKK